MKLSRKCILYLLWAMNARWSLAFVTKTTSTGGFVPPWTFGVVRSFCAPLKGTTTPYTLTDVPTDPYILQKIVEKHCQTLDLFLQKKPIAAHTQQAFHLVVQEYIDDNQGIILDSGCGTGRSTLLLGERNPHHLVIGIDKSIARLEQTKHFRKHNQNSLVAQPRDNVLLVRAELVDFWGLLSKEGISIDRHYLLYPNPYPKKSRLQNRWYAHASFPLLLQVSGNYLEVRSNWKLYLEEFAQSIQYAHEYYEREEIDNVARRLAQTHDAVQPCHFDPAWTNFEQKYNDIGEPTYQLTMDATTKQALE